MTDTEAYDRWVETTNPSEAEVKVACPKCAGCGEVEVCTACWHEVDICTRHPYTDLQCAPCDMCGGTGEVEK